MTLIALVNATSGDDVLSDAELAGYVPALQRQVTEHVAPRWGVGADVTAVPRGRVAPAGAWALTYLDRSDQPGALGYHQDATGLPSGEIGVLDCRLYDNPVSGVSSHEIVEALVDPTANLTVRGPDGWLYMREACDPVQGDWYQLDGVWLADFVLPAYFGGGPGPYDYLGLLTAGLPALRPGGYVEASDGTQWVQRRARRADGTHSWLSARARGRAAWRVRG